MDLKFGTNRLESQLNAAVPETKESTETSQPLESADLQASVAAPKLSSGWDAFNAITGQDFAGLNQKKLFDFLKPSQVTPEDWAGYNRLPLFVQGAGDANSVDMNDIAQGKVGDCWMMAPLAELAKNDPEAIKRMIHDNGNGTYTVTFKEKHFDLVHGTYFKDVPVTVTDDFRGGLGGNRHAGMGDKDAAGRGEVWPLIIEKAYAEAKGGYENIRNGGDPSEFMEALTGRTATSYAPMGIISGVSYDQLKSDFDSGKNIAFCTLPQPQPSLFYSPPLGYNLINSHCYAVQNIYTDANGKRMVQLYNPWGSDHPAPIPFDDLAANFSKVVVN